MSNLYEKVKKVINAKTNEEAEELLYGREGIQINSREYYDKIIANFIKKKENILPKDKNDIVIYDIDENTQDIYDIVLIGQIVKEYFYKYYKDDIDKLEKQKNNLENEISKINIELKKISAEHDKANTHDEHQRINDEFQKAKNKLAPKEKEDELTIVKDKLNEYYNFFNKVNKIIIRSKNNNINNSKNLKKNIQELKESILGVIKIRNSLSHRGENKDDILIIDKIVTIENDNIKLKIPIEYLDGFAKGRIILKEEDKYIIGKTNDIVYPLLKELDFDPKKIESFFYNVDPKIIDYLLNQFNNDINKIYSLPSIVFEDYDNTKKVLEYLKEHDNIKLINVSPKNLFNHFDNTIKVFELLNKEGYNLNYINKFPIGTNYNNIEFILKYLKEKKYNLEEINNISDKICMYFANFEESKDLLNYLTEKGYKLDFIDELLLDQNRIRKFVPPIFIKRRIPGLFEILCQNGFNKELIEKIPAPSLGAGEIPIIRYNKEQAETLIKVLNHIKSLKFDLNDIDKLPEELFFHYEETLKLLDYAKKNKYSFKDICEILNLSPFWHVNPTSVFEIYDELREKEIDAKKLPREILGYYIFDFNGFNQILNFIKKQGYNLNIMYNLPREALLHPINTKRILVYLKEQGYEPEVIAKIPRNLYSSFKKTIALIDQLKVIEDKKLIYQIIGVQLLNSNTIKLVNYIEKNEIDLETKQMFIKLFKEHKNLSHSQNIIDFMQFIEKYKVDLKTKEEIINNIANNHLLNFNKVILILKYFENKNILLKSSIPKKLFKVQNFNNVDYLLRRVNNDYERLDEFPIEFFTCDYELLDEMCKRYDSNLCKSIFGINNPKIIGLLIYANSVLSEYSNIISNDIILDIDNSIIKLAMEDTFKYKDNITAVEMNEKEYINQFNINRNTNKKNTKIINTNYKNSGYHKNANDEYFNPYIDEYDESYNPIYDDEFKPSFKTKEEAKNNILDKLRNSTAHFRFKLVKDKDGSIIDDKIYLYDEDNNGINNFNIIIEIKDLLAVIKDIDDEMDKIKTADENYTSSGYHKNANDEYFNPYTDEYDESYNPRQEEIFNEGKGRRR